MKANSNESLGSGSPSQSGATSDTATEAEKAAAATQGDRVDEAAPQRRDDGDDPHGGNAPRSDVSRDVDDAHDPRTKQVETNARHADANLP